MTIGTPQSLQPGEHAAGSGRLALTGAAWRQVPPGGAGGHPGAEQQRPDLAIAVATEPSGQSDDGGRERIFVFAVDSHVALDGAVLAQYATCTTFPHAEL